MGRLGLAFAAMLSAWLAMSGGAQSQTADAGAAQTAPLKARYAVKPYPGSFAAAALAIEQQLTPGILPLGTLSFTASKDQQSYKDVIVGQSPLATPLVTTHVKVMVVPLIIHIGSSVFNSVLANSCGGSQGHTDLANLLHSPILTQATFDGGTGVGHAAKINGKNMGLGTYIDQQRRSEFLKDIGGGISPYHTVFDVTVEAPIGVPASVTAGHSTTYGGPGCSLLGEIEYNFWDGYITSTLLPAVNAKPHAFVMFVMHDVVLYDTTLNNCCILGYHGAEGNFQTYSPLDYDTTGDFGSNVLNISVAAHEVAEWMDDPLGNNPTPNWGGIGQVSGCQNNWEVGDPLSGTLFPPITMYNNVVYNPQELAYWAWFYAADHDTALNVGAGKKYSTNGTFAGPSKDCPTGGTFPN